MNISRSLNNPLRRLLRNLKRNRDPRLKLLRKMPKHSVCAEVGVWKGEFSSLILSITIPEKFHLIDPWEFQDEFPERMYGGSVAKNQRDMDLIYEDVVSKFANNPKVVFNKGKSADVLNEFPNDYFDWIYIDGNHYYEYVVKDLEISSMKVKAGGFITGDDFTWGKKYGSPVKRAVLDFTSARGLENNLKIIDSQYIIKM